VFRDLCLVFTLRRNRWSGDPGLYDPRSCTAVIYLPDLLRRCSGDLVECVVECVWHEVMHHAFRNCLGEQDSGRVEKEHWVMSKVKELIT